MTTTIVIPIDHLLIAIHDTLPTTNTPIVVISIPLLERNILSLAVRIAQSLPTLRKNTLMMGRTVRMSRMSVLSKIPKKKCPKFKKMYKNKKKMYKNKKKCAKLKLIVQYSDDPGINSGHILEVPA
jgi:hypothetical protein